MRIKIFTVDKRALQCTLQKWIRVIVTQNVIPDMSIQRDFLHRGCLLYCTITDKGENLAERAICILMKEDVYFQNHPHPDRKWNSGFCNVSYNILSQIFSFPPQHCVQFPKPLGWILCTYLQSRKTMGMIFFSSVIGI